MAIPDFQSIMLPALELLGNRNTYSLRDVTQILADHYQLSLEELDELLPSRRDTTFHNRVTWALNYLKRAELVVAPERGYYQITPLGIDLLKSPPNKITIRFLKEHFGIEVDKPMHSKEQSRPVVILEEDEREETPEERLDRDYQAIRSSLEAELLEQVKKCSPRFFERLVVELLVKLGYGGTLANAGKAIGGTGDEGIDGVIYEDRLGLDIIYIQAKRWNNVVGRPEIQAFAGALQGQRARKGVFITTSDFAKTAREYVERIDNKIVLINGQELASLMFEYGIGVFVRETYEIKKIDSDYFIE